MDAMDIIFYSLLCSVLGIGFYSYYLNQKAKNKVKNQVLQILDNLPISKGSISANGIKMRLSNFLQDTENLEEILEQLVKSGKVIKDYRNYESKAHLEKRKEKRKQEKEKAEKTRQKEKKNLVEKYGELDGLRIFNGEISHSDYLVEKGLKEKYGDDIGEAIFNGIPKVGMTIEMNQEIDKQFEIEPQHIEKDNDNEKYYYTNYDHHSQRETLGFILTIVFTDGKISDIQDIESSKQSFATSTNEDGIWMDMPKDVLLKACGQPKDKKKTVGRDLIKEKWYYGDRETRQGTTVYKWEVRLENGVVSGWAELE